METVDRECRERKVGKEKIKKKPLVTIANLTPNTLLEVQCGLIVFVVTVCINSPNTRVCFI